MAKLYGLALRTATETQNTEIAVRPGIVGKAPMKETGTGKFTEKSEAELSKYRREIGAIGLDLGVAYEPQLFSPHFSPAYLD